MRVVLVTLSGDPEVAADNIRAKFHGADIYAFPRAELDRGKMSERLKALRNTRPDVFAVNTQSLEWQFGQTALMLFGALAGARTSIILDSTGHMRTGSRARLIAGAPFQIASSYIRGRLALRRAGQVLDALETKILPKAPKGGSSPKNIPALPTVAYLRATPAAGTQPGGATSHINGVVNALLDSGAKVSFISNDEITGLDKERVAFKKIGPDPDIVPRSAFDLYNGMRFANAAAIIVADEPPDLIYQRYSRFSWAGVEASLKSGVPLFLEYNGSEVWIARHWDRTKGLDLLERCERLNLRAADRIFVISEVERTNLLNAGIPDEKIVVNPNGVDTDEFRPGISGGDERERLGIPADKKLVGFVGTFGPWHGVLALADAIALVPRDSDLHFLLIGDGSLRGEVVDKLSRSGDLDRVTFAGLVSHEHVPALLDACDILVSPHVPLIDGSEFFGSPTKLFEYMAMGKGIVASRLGQIGDVLEDNVTALLVEPGDAKELSHSIQRLAGDPELLARLGKAARSTAITRHTWQMNCAAYFEGVPEFIDMIGAASKPESAGKRSFNWPRILNLLLIVALALTVRSLTAHFINAHMDDPGWFPSGIFATFDRPAQDWLDGRASIFWIDDPTRTDRAVYPPGYPLWLALIYTVGQVRSPYAVQNVQWVLDAFSVLLIVGIGVTAYGWRTGLWAGWIAALWPLLATYGAVPLADSPTSWIILGAVWMLILAAKRPGLAWALGAGLLVGVSCWLRANAMFMAFIWALAIFFLAQADWRRRIVLSGTVAAAAIVIMSPIVMRNAVAFHAFVPTGLGAGTNLWEGIGETERGAKEFGAQGNDSEVVAAERAEANIAADEQFDLYYPDGIHRDRERTRRSMAIIAAASTLVRGCSRRPYVRRNEICGGAVRHLSEARESMSHLKNVCPNDGRVESCRYSLQPWECSKAS